MFAERQAAALDQDLKKCPDQLRSVLQDADQRYVGVNNKSTPPEKERQARLLIGMVQVRSVD